MQYPNPNTNLRFYYKYVYKYRIPWPWNCMKIILTVRDRDIIMIKFSAFVGIAQLNIFHVRSSRLKSNPTI